MPAATIASARLNSCVRAFLAHDPQERVEHVPLFATSAEALEWARKTAHTGRDGLSRHDGRVVLGPRYRASPPGLAGATSYDRDTPDAERAPRRRVAEMRRRPRIREAAEDEDDSGTGTWVIRPDEPQESVEDPFGLQRPTDRADEIDPEALGDSLSELPEARVVRTPGQAKEILRAGDELPRAPRETVAEIVQGAVSYPEWDYRSATYRQPGAIVREATPLLGDRDWVQRRTRTSPQARVARAHALRAASSAPHPDWTSG